MTLFFAKVELDLKWFSLLSESLCNSQGKFARRYISLSSAAPVYLYLNENCKHLVSYFCSFSSDMEKSKNVAPKSSVGFSQFSSNTLCSFVFDHLYSAVLFGFPESVWLEKVHCNKVYCGFVSQKVSGWIKFFPLLSSQGTSLPPHLSPLLLSALQCTATYFKTTSRLIREFLCRPPALSVIIWAMLNCNKMCNSNSTIATTGGVFKYSLCTH